VTQDLTEDSYRQMMKLPPQLRSALHCWIPVLIGALAGLGLLLMFLEYKRYPIDSYSRLPPRIPQEEPSSSLSPAAATERLVDAIIQLESQGNSEMVGSVGERGLMQIRETTWEEVTRRHFDGPIPFDRAFEPELNRQVGSLYLGHLQSFLYRNREHWRSDLRSLLFAAYNAGPDRVRAAHFDLKLLPDSVQSYAARASALHDWYLGSHSGEMREQLIEAAEN